MNEKKVRQVSFLPSLPKLIKKVAIYCRVSSGLKEQLDSLSAQLSGLVQMISRHHDMVLVDIYMDVTSGENPNRYEFNRMLVDAERKKLDIIFTKSISRFGRNTEDTITALRSLKENGVHVIFDEEQIDTGKESSELLISILSAYAQASNEDRRQNQLWSMKTRLDNGTSELYYRPCYGYYKNQEGVICVSPTEAEIVQLIFSSYFDGASIVGIQKILLERNIPSPRGNETWSKRSIEKILTNEKYIGDVIVRKTITSKEKGHKRINNETEDKYMATDVFPAIISKVMFDAVQDERKRRSNIVTDETGTHRKATHYSSKSSQNIQIPSSQ